MASDPRQHYDVGGVPGLHVVTNFFTEEVERRLFTNAALFHSTRDSASFGKQRHSTYSGGGGFLPDDCVGIMNGVVDSHFFPELIMQPSYVLPWTYGPGAAFKEHWDSRYSWGETVMGINLGAGCVMSFHPQGALKSMAPPASTDTGAGGGHDRLRTEVVVGAKSFRIEVYLPPRSIYIMSGPSRVDWKHGILANTEARRASFPPLPSWNRETRFRRSITLRVQKFFSDDVLRRLLERAAPGTLEHVRLTARVGAQNKFKPLLSSATPLKAQERSAYRQQFEREVAVYCQAGSGNLEFRLPAHERNYVEVDQERGTRTMYCKGLSRGSKVRTNLESLSRAAHGPFPSPRRDDHFRGVAANEFGRARGHRRLPRPRRRLRRAEPDRAVARWQRRDLGRRPGGRRASARARREPREWRRRRKR